MSEDFEPRPRPLRPYVPGGQHLTVSVAALEATLRFLRRFGHREACVFWYGARAPNGDGQVEAVFSPRQRMEPGWYDVGAPAMSEMADAIADTDWRPLAQIHSHPGVWVEHSRYDDKMVASKRALSLVIPRYGHLSAPWPQGVGVHEHVDGYWHLLDVTQAVRRVRLEGLRALRIRDFR